MYKYSAVLIGILIAIMIAFNGALDNQVGTYLATFIIHLVGLITIILILIFKKQKFLIKEKLPIYLFSAGAMGVFVVSFNNICFNKLGASLTVSLGIIGQLVLSCIIDHFGFLGMKVYKFKKKKLIGFAIIFIGIVVMTIY
ncbi:DMT family transporter [Clostridium peptidivorans]|uniref:DMT family transporter n=1 Tax=Clostridium peptidivorans TaxID=100174 RepID=UPI000BE2637F|nr:DMT family transporter [Clostridium peptidivorans]